MHRELGDGHFARAYLGSEEQSGQVICVKVFHTTDGQTQQSYKAELEAGFMELVHPNIAKLCGYGYSQIIENGQPIGPEQLFICSEFAPYGDLFDFVATTGEGLSNEMGRLLFGQCLDGTQYLHSRQVAHRDLKLENCFIGADFGVKIGDLGMKKFFGGEDKLTTQCGTRAYMAPELTGEKKEYDGEAVDIFALGMMLFMMMTCRPLQMEPCD